MTDTQTGERTLRVWPGVVAVVLQWPLFFVVPIFMPDALLYGIMGALVCALVVLLWWLFFSRAPQVERWGMVALIIAGAFAASRLIDKSIATGMMGFMFPMFSIPVLSLALVAGAVVGRRLSKGPRRASLVAAILLACVVFTLVRTNGMSGEGRSDLAWRWSKTHEEKLPALPAQLAAMPAAPAVAVAPAKIPEERPVVAKVKDPPVALPPAVAAVTHATAETGANWPGFRGPGRDGIIPGLRIKTDWSASPPVELWRREIGPGWSSFAVHGDLIYTQEQRGEDEFVTCYNATTGKPVWAHHDAARFWESNAGAGPRATPTLHDGRAYTFGATGILNALDAGNGAVLWSRNAASDAGMKTPGWGFASSPLVVGDMVIVAAAGKLAAYDLATGAPRWFGPNGGDGYSSPQLVTMDGVPQIVLMSEVGATSVAPADGKMLWKYAWHSDTRIMQPAVTADGDLLITAGDAMGGIGIRRIAVAHGPAGWTPEQRWMSAGLKPSFNDSVVHNGYVFGFDGAILACIDAKDGTRKWKGGRYGSGQLVLLRDQDVLLVISEEGQLALVKATPDQFTELAHFPALEGKTWNHPVVAGDRLLVRNGTEMVAFRLSLEGA
jgi:outer membrane protein assembly factor BamB